MKKTIIQKIKQIIADIEMHEFIKFPETIWPNAKPLTVMARVWVAATPPILAIIGIKTARNITFSIVPWKKLITEEAILESLISLKRAGSSAIITYFALDLAKKIKN